MLVYLRDGRRRQGARRNIHSEQGGTLDMTCGKLQARVRGTKGAGQNTQNDWSIRGQVRVRETKGQDRTLKMTGALGDRSGLGRQRGRTEHSQ